MSYLASSFNRNQPLTIDQIARYAPSALATRPHESRSDKYVYIPTVNIIEGMMRAGFQPFSASQSRSRIPGKTEFTKHMIRFRHMDLSGVKMAVGDILPEIILVNSHDGTSAYKLLAGMFRLVCENGLIIADSTVGAITVMHKGDIVREVIEGSTRILEDSARSQSRVATWSNLQLTSGDQRAFAEAAHTLRFADSEGKTTTPITAEQLLRPRRSEDSGNDLWKTFNRVQENVIKGGLHGTMRDGNGRRLRGVTTREVKGIDQDVKLNRALWTLAERMQELKGVAA